MRGPLFKKRACSLQALHPLTLLLGILLLGAGQFAYAELSSRFELSSARNFRGIVQTDNNLAPSASIKYSHENGAYLGALLVRNDFRPPLGKSLERIYLVGYSSELNRTTSLDLSFITYDLQKPPVGPERDWREIHLRFSFNNLTSLTLGVSDDWMGLNEQARQVEISHLYPLSPRLSLQGTGGGVFTSDSINRDYVYAELGLVYSLGANAYVRADLSATDSQAKRIFGERADTDVRISIGYLFR